MLYIFFTLESVHQIRRFAVCKGGDGISKAGVGVGERFGGDVDGTGLAADMVAGKVSTCGAGGTRAEDLAEVGWSAEVDGGGCLKEIESGGF